MKLLKMLCVTVVCLLISVNTVYPKEIKLVDLGTFKAYAYCPCRICCDKWAGGDTASGTKPEEGRTIAVDPKIIPLGTVVYVNGEKMIAEDTGSGISGKTIDVYHNNHKSALKWGIQQVSIEIESVE